ncbi:hypothetical protein RJ639_041316, partial [Escallonia herrerae]
MGPKDGGGREELGEAGATKSDDIETMSGRNGNGLRDRSGDNNFEVSKDFRKKEVATSGTWVERGYCVHGRKRQEGMRKPISASPHHTFHQDLFGHEYTVNGSGSTSDTRTKTSHSVSQVKKLKVSVIVRVQKKPSQFLNWWCINSVECLTIRIRKQSQSIGGYLINTR